MTTEEMIMENVEKMGYFSTDQKKNIRNCLLGQGSGYSEAEVEYMKRCVIKAVFDKADNLNYEERKAKETLKNRLLNTPEIEDFDTGYKLESHHQEQKWGNEKEAPPHHYIMVITKLLGKLTVSVWDRNKDKFKHHLITIAAVCFNAHKKIEDKSAFINEYFKEMK